MPLDAMRDPTDVRRCPRCYGRYRASRQATCPYCDPLAKGAEGRGGRPLPPLRPVPPPIPFFYRLIVPDLGEVALFSMAVAFLHLGSVKPAVLSDLQAQLRERSDFDLRPCMVLASFTLGRLLSLYHAMVARPKSEVEKFAMLSFAVLITAGTGIASGLHEIEHSVGFLALFPAWNILAGVILFLWWRMDGFQDAESRKIVVLPDEDASVGDLLLSSVGIVATLFVRDRVFHVYWATTYSICVVSAAHARIFASAIGVALERA